MLKRRIWLSATCILFLVGCVNNSNATTLDTPVLELNASRDGLVWEPIDGASGYEITVDGETSITNTPDYSFETNYGDYEVSIKAINEKGGKSKVAKYGYETRITRLGNLSCSGTTINWFGSDYYGLETSRDDEEYTPITDNSLEISESGTYYFRTVKGFREQGHVFYGQVIKKCIIATFGSPSNYIIEDGNEIDNATLSEGYKKYKYGSGWETSAAYVTLDDTNDRFVEGNCVDFHSWHQGVYFMFEKQIKIPGSLNEFDFSVKSSSPVTVVLSLQIAHTFIVNGIDLNGVYIKYSFTAPTAWYKYRVLMNDSAWRVNYGGGEYDFATISNMLNGAGIVIQSLADMLPYFDLFQFRINASFQTSGASVHTYFDEVKFVNSDLDHSESKVIIPPLTIEKNYAFASDNAKGSISFESETQGKFNFVSPEKTTLDVACSVENEVLTVTSNTSGKDFAATFKSADGGLTLDLQSATGTLSQYMENIKVESILLLEDFESYEETGFGYDKNNPIDKRSGLRGAFICDYYSGNENDTSPIGGKSWSLMEDDDYMYLNTTDKHSGNKSADIKSYGNTSRYMTYCLYDGSGEGFRGKTFSFWAKGGSEADVTIRAGVYFVSIANSSNHNDSGARTSLDIVIPKNSDWKEYTIELDISRYYYGFSLNTLGVKIDDPQRILIDDIYVYNTLSPWAE